MFKILQFLTLLKLKLFGKLIGQDEYKNRYFELKSKDYLGRKKRLCVYSGIVEASKIPANWHAWMHHTTNDPISHKKLFWMKAHTPDLTGTTYAFTPNKHSQFNVYGKSNMNKIIDYTPWDGKLSEEENV